MATRFYLPSSGAAPITPAFGGWDESGSADRVLGSLVKTGTAMTSKTVAKGTGATRALVRQYIFGPVAAQTIAAGTVKGQVRCLESATNDNLDLVPLLIRACSGDGSTYRSPAIIALGDYAAALEFGTSLTNRKIADGDATAEVITQDGDYIVVEIGEKNSSAGSSVSGSFSFGDDSATDLAEDTTTTTANNPWIELSSTIIFGVGEWSDHLNAQQAPMKKVSRLSQTGTSGSTGSVGFSASQEAVGQEFIAATSGKVIRIGCFVTKIGTPTDSVVCKIYDDGGGVPGTVLATSLPVLAAAIASQGTHYFEFSTPPSLTSGTTYYFVVWRTGALSTSNYYGLGGSSSDPYADGVQVLKRTSPAWEDQPTNDCYFIIETEGSDWYKFEIDRGAAKLRVYRSTDAGANWTEQDSANAPTVTTVIGRMSIAAQRKGDKFYVVIPVALDQIKHTFPFDSAANTWGSATSVTLTGNSDTPGEFGLNVGSVGAVFHNYREFSTQSQKDYSVFQAASELVSGTRYRRIGHQWGTTQLIAYLTGAGSTVHYDLRSLLNDWRDWTYVFYSKSDSTQIQVATRAVDAVSTTVVGGLSNTAIDQTAKYPLGLGCHFWRDGVNHVAVPYVDAGTSKLLYCEAGTPANTAANWQVSTITTQAAETSTSNPGFVVADSEQGGKLFYFFVDDSDGKVYWCHDDGSFTWSEPELFDATVTSGLAGTLSDQTIGMLLREVDGDLVFKKFDVFF